jgi:8-oxo-dGTP pyrophosphatase MutT (NUDIX family)
MSADGEIRVAGTAVVLRDGPEGVETLMLRRPSKGSFAGAWVFPGGRVDPGDWVDADDAADAARAAAVRETQEETAIRIADVTLLSRWTPPPEQPVKFRTWFFLARDLGDEVRVNPGEIEEAVWLSPERVFAQHEASSLTLFPPTWVTLNGLLGHRTVDDALAAVGEPALYATNLRDGVDGRFALWAGDAEHAEEPGGPDARHRLLMGTLPWRYERR